MSNGMSGEIKIHCVPEVPISDLIAHVSNKSITNPTLSDDDTTPQALGDVRTSSVSQNYDIYFGLNFII